METALVLTDTSSADRCDQQPASLAGNRCVGYKVAASN